MFGGVRAWAEGEVPFHGHVVIDGAQGLANGAWTVVLMIVMVLLIALVDPFVSGVQTLRWAPAVIVFFAGVLWFGATREVTNGLRAWEALGGHGTIAPGFWLLSGGLVVMAAAVPIAMLTKHPSATAADPSNSGSRDAAIEALGALIGGALGLGLGLAVSASDFRATIIIGAIGGAAIGAAAGGKVTAALLHRLSRRSSLR